MVDIWDLNSTSRWSLYVHWVKKFVVQYTQHIDDELDNYEQVSNNTVLLPTSVARRNWREDSADRKNAVRASRV